jgi:hypothetical protein
LAEEVGMERKRFEPGTVEVSYCLVDQLKRSFDEVEISTTTINKRESLLGVKVTEFAELNEIQEVLKPLNELWGVAYNFSLLLPRWLEERFETLDP